MFEIVQSYNVDDVKTQVNEKLADDYKIINSFSSDGQITVLLLKEETEEETEEENSKTSKK